MPIYSGDATNCIWLYPLNISYILEAKNQHDNTIYLIRAENKQKNMQIKPNEQIPKYQQPTLPHNFDYMSSQGASPREH